MPVFQEWLAPFNELGAKTVTINNTGGTDHQAVDAVGIPGFQFIQDAIEYDTRTHHTNMDSYDHLIPVDLQQAATIVAAFVYNAAQRDEKLPRKEMPKPRANPAR
jgi:Zn-dependent M28 family amino/carboxypeptidase